MQEGIDILDQELLIDEDKLLSTIWTKPKLTLQYILKYCPKKYVTALLVTSGVVSALARNDWWLNPSLKSFIVLIFVAFFSGCLCYAFAYINAMLLSWTGRWLNGKGNTDQFFTVLAWSSVPPMWAIFLLIPKILFFRGSSFSIDLDEDDTARLIVFILIAAIMIALYIWSVVILVKGIEIIQNFNSKKAFLNFILPILVVIIPILAIIGIVFIIR